MQLAHDIAGSGEPSLVLIHGAFGERGIYRNQVEYFRPSRRVLALDLRGHGQSDKPDEVYSIRQFAEDVAELCREVGIDRADIVGHSMGGVVAVELAGLYPALVRSVATLDSPSIIPGWTERHMGPYTDEIHSDDFRALLRQFLDVASLPVDDPDRRRVALEAVESVPAHVVRSTWDALSSWDTVAALDAMEAPLLYLDHGQPHLDYDLLRHHCPQLVTGQTVGAGHRAPEEVPAQVNAMLDRFLTHALALAEHARSIGGAFVYKSAN